MTDDTYHALTPQEKEMVISALDHLLICPEYEETEKLFGIDTDEKFFEINVLKNRIESEDEFDICVNCQIAEHYLFREQEIKRITRFLTVIQITFSHSHIPIMAMNEVTHHLQELKRLAATHLMKKQEKEIVANNQPMSVDSRVALVFLHQSLKNLIKTEIPAHTVESVFREMLSHVNSMVKHELTVEEYDDLSNVLWKGLNKINEGNNEG